MAPTGSKKPKSSVIFSDSMTPMGIARAGILSGLGMDDGDLRTKPFVGIANSWTELNPGHAHLRTVAEAVKEGIREAGGVPFEFNVPAPCDGIANGNDGMRFILAQRDLIADIVETYARSQSLDALVTISSCDKINPGMLIAAARLDVPAIMVPGGSNIWMARLQPGFSGSIDNKDYEDFRMKICTATAASCGACEIMGTANTLQCLMETLGMSLPGTASLPAGHAALARMAREAGRRVLGLLEEGLTPRRILTRQALENAVMVDLAIGGSTNSTLHLPALARALGFDLPLAVFNDFAARIPTLTDVYPNGPRGMHDFVRAGGVPGVMKQLGALLHGDCLTVSGKTAGVLIAEAPDPDPAIIRPANAPVHPQGGTVALFGNLAPEGCVVKQSAVEDSMRVFRGKAVVCDTEAAALEAVSGGRVAHGDVLVIRYEGPKGAPGMPELLSVTLMIDVLGLEAALVTDGRFSGASKGPCIGHVSPEAYEGGPIGLLQDGDEISIDIPRRTIHAHVPEQEFSRRRGSFRRLERPVPPGYMRRYQRLVGSAAKGAVLE